MQGPTRRRSSADDGPERRRSSTASGSSRRRSSTGGGPSRRRSSAGDSPERRRGSAESSSRARAVTATRRKEKRCPKPKAGRGTKARGRVSTVERAQAVLAADPEGLDEFMKKIRTDPYFCGNLYNDCPEMRKVLDSNPEIRKIFEDPERMRAAYEAVYTQNGGAPPPLSPPESDEDMMNNKGGGNPDWTGEEKKKRRGSFLRGGGGTTNKAGAVVAGNAVKAKGYVSTAMASTSPAKLGTKALKAVLPSSEEDANADRVVVELSAEGAADRVMDPDVAEEIDRILESSKNLEDAIEENDDLRKLRDTNPFAASVMSDPDAFRALMDPDNIKCCTKLNAAMEQDFLNLMGGGGEAQVQPGVPREVRLDGDVANSELRHDSLNFDMHDNRQPEGGSTLKYPAEADHRAEGGRNRMDAMPGRDTLRRDSVNFDASTLEGTAEFDAEAEMEGEKLEEEEAEEEGGMMEEYEMEEEEDRRSKKSRRSARGQRQQSQRRKQREHQVGGGEGGGIFRGAARLLGGITGAVDSDMAHDGLSVEAAGGENLAELAAPEVNIAEAVDAGEEEEGGGGANVVTAAVATPLGAGTQTESGVNKILGEELGETVLEEMEEMKEDKEDDKDDGRRRGQEEDDDDRKMGGEKGDKESGTKKSKLKGVTSFIAAEAADALTEFGITEVLGEDVGETVLEEMGEMEDDDGSGNEEKKDSDDRGGRRCVGGEPSIVVGGGGGPCSHWGSATNSGGGGGGGDRKGQEGGRMPRQRNSILSRQNSNDETSPPGGELRARRRGSAIGGRMPRRRSSFLDQQSHDDIREQVRIKRKSLGMADGPPSLGGVDGDSSALTTPDGKGSPHGGDGGSEEKGGRVPRRRSSMLDQQSHDDIREQVRMKRKSLGMDDHPSSSGGQVGGVEAVRARLRVPSRCISSLGAPQGTNQQMGRRISWVGDMTALTAAHNSGADNGNSSDDDDATVVSSGSGKRRAAAIASASASQRGKVWQPRVQRRASTSEVPTQARRSQSIQTEGAAPKQLKGSSKLGGEMKLGRRRSMTELVQNGAAVAAAPTTGSENSSDDDDDATVVSSGSGKRRAAAAVAVAAAGPGKVQQLIGRRRASLSEVPMMSDRPSNRVAQPRRRRSIQTKGEPKSICSSKVGVDVKSGMRERSSDGTSQARRRRSIQTEDAPKHKEPSNAVGKDKFGGPRSSTGLVRDGMSRADHTQAIQRRRRSLQTEQPTGRIDPMPAQSKRLEQMGNRGKGAKEHRSGLVLSERMNENVAASGKMTTGFGRERRKEEGSSNKAAFNAADFF